MHCRGNRPIITVESLQNLLGAESRCCSAVKSGGSHVFQQQLTETVIDLFNQWSDVSCDEFLLAKHFWYSCSAVVYSAVVLHRQLQMQPKLFSLSFNLLWKNGNLKSKAPAVEQPNYSIGFRLIFLSILFLSSLSWLLICNTGPPWIIGHLSLFFVWMCILSF